MQICGDSNSSPEDEASLNEKKLGGTSPPSLFKFDRLRVLEAAAATATATVVVVVVVVQEAVVRILGLISVKTRSV